MSFITIVNGKATAHPEFELVRETARRFASPLQITSERENGTVHCREALQSGATRLIIAGGDGTIHEVVQALAPEFPQIDIGIIPLGTGNDLARSLDLEISDIPLAIEAAYSGQTVAIDVIRARNDTTRYFVNSATGGFGGNVSVGVSSESKQMWGPFAYWMTAVSQLSDLPEYELDMVADGKPLQRKLYGLAISNSRTIGGGFSLAPNALLNDGLFIVNILPVLTPFEVLAAGVDATLGRHKESEYIETFKARSLSLRCRPEMLFSLDGELEKCSHTELDVLSKKLHVVVGKHAALQREPEKDV